VFIGDGDFGDFAVVATVGELFAALMEQRVATQLLGRFDRRPAH
jgi:hypothetical protein